MEYCVNSFQNEILCTVIPGRLEAKSEKGPRNHFRGDGMLEGVTHASSLD